MERRKKCSKYRKYKCEKNKFILIKSNVVSFSVVLNLKKKYIFYVGGSMKIQINLVGGCMMRSTARQNKKTKQKTTNKQNTN